MWRSSLLWRFFGAYSVLLAMSLGLLGLVVIRRLEKRLLQETHQGLEMKTWLVSELVTSQNLDPAARQQQVKQLADETQTRITLIAADGRVLADSAEEPGQMENHLDRPEVRAAATGGTGAATRYSETVHEPLLYHTRRLATESPRYVRLAVPLVAMTHESRWLQQAVWTAVGTTLLLALLLSWLVARRFATPLAELAAAARRIAQGSYGERVTVLGQDEAGTLASAFNEMSQACATHIARMERDRQRLRAILGSMVECVLVIDVDQRVEFLNEAAAELLNHTVESAEGRKLWQLVRHHQLGHAAEQILTTSGPFHVELDWHAHDRKVLAVQGTRLPADASSQPGAVLVLHDITHLRKLERMRQDFVANVSHELKTPLATIQATVETLLDGALRDPNHNVRFLERIRESADRLYRLVQDLLTLGRIESGMQSLEVEPILLDQAIESCVARMETRAAAKSLRLEVEPPGEPLTVLAEEEALAEILENLTDNAIKYTPTEGTVTLRWFSEQTEAVVQVADTGVGIPDKDLPRIFERFYRVDKARSRELGGTGLGLSIVKHLVQALGGTVHAASQVQQGSTFTVRLPLIPQAAEGVSTKATHSA